MKHVACEGCGSRTPTGETFLALDRVLCGPCVEASLQEGTRYAEGSVRRQADPTMCANCGADNGAADLPRLAGLPMCPACTGAYRARPFPLWVKVGLAVMLGLAAFSLVRNLRFFRAHFEARRALAAYEAGDAATAAERMASAAARVPEAEGLQGSALFLEGILLVAEDRSAEALEVLRRCRRNHGPGEALNHYLLVAERGAAFDAKDYDTFLRASRDLMIRQPREARAVAGVASALACKYAVTGEEHYKRESLEMLARAAALAGSREEEDLETYARRIRHRLESRQIITAKEYERRFPQGHEQGGKP